MSYQFSNDQAAANAPSSFGLSPTAAALVSYLFIPWTSIAVLVTEKQNRFVRFHAFQSLLLGLGMVALTILLSIIIGIVTLIAGAVSPYAGIIVSVLSLILWIFIALAILALWALCLYKAYRGETYKVPFVGKTAEKMANK
jgi:Predicted membrane protein